MVVGLLVCCHTSVVGLGGKQTHTHTHTHTQIQKRHINGNQHTREVMNNKVRKYNRDHNKSHKHTIKGRTTGIITRQERISKGRSVHESNFCSHCLQYGFIETLQFLFGSIKYVYMDNNILYFSIIVEYCNTVSYQRMGTLSSNRSL